MSRVWDWLCDAFAVFEGCGESVYTALATVAAGCAFGLLLGLLLVAGPARAQAVPSGFVVIGQHAPGNEYPVLACTPGAELGFQRSSTGAWFEEGVCPAGGSYTCSVSYDPATGQVVGWSGYGACFERVTVPPDPPASAASGAYDGPSAATVEGFGRILAASALVVVFGFGLSVGKGL